MSHRHALWLGLIVGLVFILAAWSRQFEFLRIVSGLTFVFFFSGFPYSLLILPKTSSFWERLLVSVGLSLLLTYPAGFLNVLWEGQSAQAIFGYHLFGDAVFIFGFYLLGLMLVFIKRKAILDQTINLNVKQYWPLVFPLVLSLFFSFYQLGVPDLNGDEYDLGYQAYDLVDGIFAGRKAYVLSFSAHPPLSMYIQHYTINILNPGGLDGLEDWMFRFAPATLGVIGVSVVYLITKELSRSVWAAVVASSLLAVNNYHLFVSRIFQREIFLIFYLLLGIYFFLRYLRTNEKYYLYVTAIFSGAALLVKTVAFLWILAAVVTMIVFKKTRVVRDLLVFLLICAIFFSSVVLYNLGAYLTTGYMDIFFANIFHTKTHPGSSTIVANPSWNAVQIVKLLADQYGWWAFLPLSLVAISSFRQIKNPSFVVLLIFLVLELTLFIVIGMQVYYLSILTPIIVILFSLSLYKLKRPLRFVANLLIVGLFIYSINYSAKTLYDDSFIQTKDYTSVFPKISLTQSYSLTTRNFLEEKGWKDIRSKIDQVYDNGSCLFWNVDVKDLHLRRYLGIADGIKKYYLGANYSRPYLTCAEHPGAVTKIRIYFDETGRVDTQTIYSLV